MLYRLMADAVLLVHLAFIVFALLGGLLVLRYPRLLYLHLAALTWGVLVQWANWICPLTPLENILRQLGGQAGYAGGFIEHWLSVLLYPPDLTLALRYGLGLVLIAINIIVYWRVFTSSKTRNQTRSANSLAHPLSNRTD